MSEVTQILSDLADNHITLDNAAARFEKLPWPSSPALRQPLRARDAAGDATPEPPGSFAEVQTAYAAGQITAEQYARLAEAASAAIWRENHCPAWTS
jgi:hypothetical protein